MKTPGSRKHSVVVATLAVTAAGVATAAALRQEIRRLVTGGGTITEAISRSVTVANEAVVDAPPINEAISRSFSIKNIAAKPASPINEAISRSLSVCNAADPSSDEDQDGVHDCYDACPGSDDTLDCDLDGVPDGCEQDSDGDGTPDDCVTALAGGNWTDDIWGLKGNHPDNDPGNPEGVADPFRIFWNTPRHCDVNDLGSKDQ